jgi:peptide/nickel transport system ATP-binding protein
MTAAALEVEDLVIRFAGRDRRLQVVDGISFTVGRGEIVAVVGESGCGKTVTAMATVGLLPAVAEVQATAIRVGGKDVYPFDQTTLQQVRGKAVGFVFQEPLRALNPAMRIGRQLQEVTARHLRLSRQEENRRVIEYLDLVGIPHPEQVARMYPHEISGGMRQRVLIAAAIICEPVLLIADEPTTALDVTIQAQILDLMFGLKEELGMAIILITHNLGVVAESARRVVVMYCGKVVEEGPVMEIFKQPQHPYTQGLLQSLPRLEEKATGQKQRLMEIPGIVPSPYNLPSGCMFHPRCPKAQQICQEQEPPLEQVPGGHYSACFFPG